MDRTLSPSELDPARLPPGTCVGPWRIEGAVGRGTYGSVYRAVSIGGAGSAPVALKLGLHPWDERFRREAALLSRLRHPHVPRLLDHGFWKHPSRPVAYPYLAMQWVEGVSLDAWARTQAPTSRQAMRVLAQVARALEATHAAGAVHRDVKGDNVLVHPEQGRVVLTDFGAGYYAGAERLTWQSLPPGTANYRSPEAWRFAYRSVKDPNAHYGAPPSDDLFALGVTAYRLVTGRYPPSTDPEREESRIWYREKNGAPAPLELNPRVHPRLSAIILRMLAVRGAERGTAGEVAAALEQAAEQAGPEADQSLGGWEEGAARPSEGNSVAEILRRRRPWSSEEELFPFEAEPLELEAPAEPREVKTLPKVEAPAQREPPRARRPVWLGYAATMALGAVLASALTVAVLSWWRGAPAVGRPDTVETSHDEEAVAVGNAALASTSAAVGAPAAWDVLGLPMPKEPLPGQRRAPQCRLPLEDTINGGCWIQVANVKPPCKDMGYEWKGGCYLPSYPSPRSPTSGKP